MLRIIRLQLISLAGHLRAHWNGRDIHAVIGIYKDKDIESISEILVAAIQDLSPDKPG